jgi:hypothetical protein
MALLQSNGTFINTVHGFKLQKKEIKKKKKRKKEKKKK